MFESARAKIARAREHFDFLKTDFARFIGGKPYSIRKEREPDSDITLLIYEPEPIPDCWSVHLGELLYNLRSALDHTVCELSGGVSGSEFPIFKDVLLFYELEKPKDRQKATARSGLHKTRRITHQQAWSYIEAMQPYNADKPRNTPLWGLHELNNIDKHRTLHLCRRRHLWARLETDRPVSFSESCVYFPDSLEQRAVVGRLLGVDCEVNVDYDFALFITFDESEVPEVVGYPVEPICDVFIKQVAMIVDRIESLVG